MVIQITARIDPKAEGTPPGTVYSEELTWEKARLAVIRIIRGFPECRVQWTLSDGWDEETGTDAVLDTVTGEGGQ